MDPGTGVGKDDVVAFATDRPTMVMDMDTDRVADVLATETNASIAGAIALGRGEAAVLDMAETIDSVTSSNSSADNQNMETSSSHQAGSPWCLVLYMSRRRLQGSFLAQMAHLLALSPPEARA